MVHYKKLWAASQSELDRILQASQGCIRCDSLDDVRLALPKFPQKCLTMNSTLFTTYLILTLIALYPSKAFRSESSSRYSDNESGHQPWEMLEAPRTPGTTGGLKSPTTPRTKAFNTLSGKRPQQNNGKAPERKGNVGIQLRHHVSMGDETYQGPSGR